MKKGMQELVRSRARQRCEYCLIAQSFFRERFHIDHVIAVQHGGAADIGNLALSCLRCNRHKGPNIAGLDPETGQLVALFNPRWDRWDKHFAWNDLLVTGLTATGRATITTLNMNHLDRLAVREALRAEGEFPPDPR